MKLKTDTLDGPRLAWAVARAQGYKTIRVFPAWENRYGARGPAQVMIHTSARGMSDFDPERSHALAGEIQYRERISVQYEPSLVYDDEARWKAFGPAEGAAISYGRTPQVAICRCFVDGVLGPEVDVPDVLCVRTEVQP